LVLEAVQAGVNVDLLEWAIRINEDPVKVQMHLGVAHPVAAVVAESG
jgi:hypothetical protein